MESGCPVRLPIAYCRSTAQSEPVHNACDHAGCRRWISVSCHRAPARYPTVPKARSRLATVLDFTLVYKLRRPPPFQAIQPHCEFIPIQQFAPAGRSWEECSARAYRRRYPRPCLPHESGIPTSPMTVYCRKKGALLRSDFNRKASPACASSHRPPQQ